MFALGCIQSRHCNRDTCPTRIATQNPARYQALDVDLKATRVANYHAAMIENLMELVAAAGLSELEELQPRHIYRRVHGTHIRHYAELYPSITQGCLLTESGIPKACRNDWVQAKSRRW